MTRATNARIAGVTFLVCIAATFAGMTLFASATRGVGVAAQLAGIAQHATDVRLTILLGRRRAAAHSDVTSATPGMVNKLVLASTTYNRFEDACENWRSSTA